MYCSIILLLLTNKVKFVGSNTINDDYHKRALGDLAMWKGNLPIYPEK